MSRVLADTFFVRLAVATALAVPLAGCGGDDASTATTQPAPTTASTPATTTTPVVPTTPATTSGEDQSKASTPAASDDPSAAGGATIDTPETVAKASPKKKSNDDLAAQMKKAYDALKDAGLDPGKPLVSGESSGALQIGGTTIVFYPSPREAAAFAAKVQAAQPSVKLVRKANRLFLFLALPNKPEAEQLKDYRKIRQVTNGAV